MMNLQMKNPASAPTLNGVGIEKLEEIRMNHNTASKAYSQGREAYPFTFQTGRRAASLWLTGRPKMTLADFRDNRWRSYCAGVYRTHEEKLAFNAGFERALAEHIAGANHG